MIRLTVRINGTDQNPWHKLGLKQNPFPEVAIREYDEMCMRIQSLDGDPIKSTQDIRDRLNGFSKEFVDLCCAAYQPGQRVSFSVQFPEK